MQIMQKFQARAADPKQPPVTIAFLGDSVTQGCFEVYMDRRNCIETVYDKDNAYHAHLSRLLNLFYPNVPVNIINAGLSGDSSLGGKNRLERDVLRHNPDLVVVCFGLNDCTRGKEAMPQYTQSLDEIFSTLQDNQIETIFMTPNMMNTEVSVFTTDPQIRAIAADTAAIQNGGILEMYLDAAKEVCKTHQVPVCDCYAKWKCLYQNGVDTTELLANKINHPTRQMNWLFAVSLLETMMQQPNMEA